MALLLSDFSEQGLYLLLQDGRALALTYKEIEARSHAILADPRQVPDAVRNAAGFQLCSVCPKRGSGDTCHAIRPILATWADLDGNFSTERVTAVYRSERADQLIVAETTLPKALQYISLLSLMHYCEVGKEYSRYFFGVHPLMNIDDVVIRVYLNMFWACGGDVKKTRTLVARFHDDITVTTHCQMTRLRMICHSDSLLNALILTQIASEFLGDRVDELIEQHARDFERFFLA